MAKDYLDDGRETLAAIETLLVASIELRGLSRWQLPGKVQILRESLLWRVEELAQNAYDALAAERFVASALAVRAVMETAAALVFLERIIQRGMANGVTEKLIAKIDRFLINSKIWEELDEPLHVNDMLREVEELIPGYFTEHYATLSEFSHPNYSGTFGAFGEFDKVNLLANFKKGGRNPDHHRKTISMRLAATLHIAKGYYEKIGPAFEPFVAAVDKYYEDKPVEKPAAKA